MLIRQDLNADGTEDYVDCVHNFKIAEGRFRSYSLVIDGKSGQAKRLWDETHVSPKIDSARLVDLNADGKMDVVRREISHCGANKEPKKRIVAYYNESSASPEGAATDEDTSFNVAQLNYCEQVYDAMIENDLIPSSDPPLTITMDNYEIIRSALDAYDLNNTDTIGDHPSEFQKGQTLPIAIGGDVYNVHVWSASFIWHHIYHGAGFGPGYRWELTYRSVCRGCVLGKED